MEAKELKVLVVDDNVYKRMDIKKALECNGVKEIICFKNQEEVWDELNNCKTLPHLIITDMQYPLNSYSEITSNAGEILIDELANRGIDIPVVVCSSLNVTVDRAVGNVWYNQLRDLEYDILEQLQYVLYLYNEEKRY